MDSLLLAVAVLMFLVSAAWLRSEVNRRSRDARRRALQLALAKGDRDAVSSLLSQGTDESAQRLARELLDQDSLQGKLEGAQFFLKKRGEENDQAIEALAEVLRVGNEAQRREALRLLKGPHLKSAPAVRTLLVVLEADPDPGLRIEAILLLCGAAESGRMHDPHLLREAVRSIARRLGDPSKEVRFVVRTAFSRGGPLVPFAPEVEVLLMELLRSGSQDVVDAAASIIVENRGVLRAAVSCVPASKANHSVVRSLW